MKKILFSNKNGFSLIELMVVVAIIAILASFAIPQYQNFQGKARQKEGLMLLNSYYVSAKATEAEGGAIYGNFEATGFAPSGIVHYRVAAVDGVLNPASGPNNDTCITTALTCTNGFNDWSEATATTSGSFYANADVSCTQATNSNNGTFTTCASANIRSGSTTDVDTWSVNNRKVIVNTNDGLN